MNDTEGRKGAWRWSMERRLLLLFTGGTMVLLLAISAGLYAAVTHYMAGRMNGYLADKIEDAVTDLNEPEGLEGAAAELMAPGTGDPDYWLRIVTKDGRTAAETRGMEKRMPAREFPAPGGVMLARRDWTDAAGRWISMGARRVSVHGQEYVVQVGEDRHMDLDFLRELRAILGGVLLLGGAGAGGLAVGTTRQALRPLKEMEAAVERVRAPRLTERLGQQAWPDELAPLALAFDEMMDRLEESFTRLSQFSADLAHELRTPLANLRGEAEVALTRMRTAEEYREVLESSMEEYERLTEMAAKLLFLARADAAEAEVKLEALDGRAVIDSMAEWYEPYAEERGVVLRCAGAGRLTVDGLLLRRALANLLENALRHTPAGYAVAMEVAEGCVRVKDQGCGIAREHLPRLFDRFYQVDGSRRDGGTGLGLALVKSIAELHGGRVEVASRMGEGTEFTLHFPSPGGEVELK